MTIFKKPCKNYAFYQSLFTETRFGQQKWSRDSHFVCDGTTLDYKEDV